MARIRLRTPSASARALPDFLVIGAQRSGTSSLYKYLGAHPSIIPSLRKEIEYFSTEYGRGEAWYRAHFPLELRRSWSKLVRGQRPLTFEATPDYLLDHRAAARAHAAVPNAKIIVLLRNPVERAHSNYFHNLRYGMESLSFEEALEAEAERLAGERDRMEDSDYRALPLRRYSYVERGMYAEQLRPWLDRFGDQVLVMPSEGLFRDPSGRLADLYAFLGVDPSNQREFRNYSYTSKPQPKEQLDPKTRDWLQQQFEAPNNDLFELLGWDLGWRVE